MALDATFKAALEEPSPLLFYAIELVLSTDSPGRTLRLLDGAGFCTFNGHTWTGSHDTYGTLELTEVISDGIGDEVPHMVFSIHPPTNTAAAALAAATVQGAAASLYMGALDSTTGLVIGTPELIFAGEVDVPTLKVGERTRAVEIDCGCIWERLFENDEGLSLTDASHQDIWPGETGFDLVQDVDRQVPWGVDGPRPGVITNASQSGWGNASGSQALAQMKYG